MTRFGRQADELDSVGKPLVWFVVSLGVVALALYVIGIEEVLRTLARTDRRDAASVLVMAAVTVTSRGIALRILFEVMDTSVSTLRAIALYVASTFLNDVTPSGQAGGAPASGLLIAYTGDARYEIGLAAVLVVNFLATLVMLAFGLAGVGYLATTATAGPAGPDYRLLAATTAGLVLLITSGVAALWRYRSTATTVLVEGVVAIIAGDRAIRPPVRRARPLGDHRTGRAFLELARSFRGGDAAGSDRAFRIARRRARSEHRCTVGGVPGGRRTRRFGARAGGRADGRGRGDRADPGRSWGNGGRTDRVAFGEYVGRGGDDRRCSRALAGGDPLAPDARRRGRHRGTRRVRSYPMKPRSVRFFARSRALDR